MMITRCIARASCIACLSLVVGVAPSGCDRGDDKAADTKGQQPPQQAKPPATAAAAPLVPVAQAIDWCKEHGLPESICVQCHEELAASFKDKRDWCKEHGVPESQCFKCHPELREKFAAAYKAKYGKEPPALGGEDKHDHDAERK